MTGWVTDDTPAREPILTPAPKTLAASLLGFFSIVACFFASAMTAFSVIGTAQHLWASIPPGTIERVEDSKGGKSIFLVGGGRHSLPARVLRDAGPNPIEPRPGDHVRKQRMTFAYTLNDRELGGLGWIAQNELAPVRLRIPLGAYLVFGGLYAAVYRRTPLGDVQWSGMTEPPLQPVRSRRAALVAVVGGWAYGALVFTLGLSFMLCCLFTIIAPFMSWR